MEASAVILPDDLEGALYDMIYDKFGDSRSAEEVADCIVMYLRETITPAALSAAPEASGWTEVTEDPATWPDTFDQVLCETDGFGDGYGPPSDCYRREMRGEVARMICARERPRLSRWMPWPALAVSAAAGRKEGK